MQTSSGSKLDFGRVALLLVLLGVGWYFWDSPAVWPLKLLVVMVHESGHALATLLAGGAVDRITLAANESGACLAHLPTGMMAQVAVYSAGYVGSALAGAFLLLATFRFRLRRLVLVAACLGLAVMGVLYAGDGFTLAFCMGTALVLGLAAKYLPDGGVDMLNLFLAAFTALYAAFELRSDLWNGATRSVSDASLLADLTPVPSWAWASLWSLVSLVLLGLFARWSLRAARPEGLGYSLTSGRR
ncbi:M50 family metallopeptidase [Archangium lansingense]|uniref:M50 family metallopeptidase n=1 Tax=Archangium lansingense TaxID=2995310 RepID=A0ABT4A5T9_9BACT|nr:M50 family metallopeptidase [Archangium lansinium]MCY1076374.1 M50 family metallopeptidase [Archangium lansinium]